LTFIDKLSINSVISLNHCYYLDNRLYWQMASL